MKIKNIVDAEKYLYRFFPKSMKQKFQGDWGLARTKYFLDLLGSPQNKIKIVHIAGTSGKGSTSWIISNLLHSLGFKVGLHLSPPLLDIRERFEINNTFISETEFCTYLENFIPYIEKVKNSEYGVPSFFEILISLAYFIFYDKKVDYAVVETAMGGMLDATNAADAPNKFVVITKIGSDHTQILGNTLGEIAYQKAMIMHKNNLALSTWQTDVVRSRIEKVAAQQGGHVMFLKEESISNIRSSIKELWFDLKFGDLELKGLRARLVGGYQAENIAVALASIFLLHTRDHFKISEEKVRSILLNLQFPGRMEIHSVNGKTIIIDGAHNPQKMEAFIKSLTTLFPHKKFHFLLAFKKEKDYSVMLDTLIPYASKITLTSFVKKADLLITSVDPEEIGKTLEKRGFNEYEIIYDPHEAVRKILENMQEPVVVTGSLYFISEIYLDIKKLKN